ncbi:hypothetical protein MCOL2_17102 [Listeria fleischmannii FSL S10-1203]|uniref:Uncharacterized protein n=1 Tax=Listeria fleischmannii FSL S10-1203 TaxID=1265822 RepID=W7D897_9LIST|nr:hypothetical protein MCOL2_17102 [Listeria fleischmannii FSL S10-1203]
MIGVLYVHIEMQNLAGLNEACEKHEKANIDRVIEALSDVWSEIEEGESFEFVFDFQSPHFLEELHFTLIEKNKRYVNWRFDRYFF